MKVNGTHYHSIWREAGSHSVRIIDQTRLPHHFEIIELMSLEDACLAIRDMQVRGAPLIGATAAYGLALAMHEKPDENRRASATQYLLDSRPTAVNLQWALDRINQQLLQVDSSGWKEIAYAAADRICHDDIRINEAIGRYGFSIIQDLWRQGTKEESVNILTHCNAGWLATVDWGTALAPIYKAHDAGIPVHVWVDETRPRNQGASLTVWELTNHGVPNTLIVDNAGGHLMQIGKVDMCLVGSDRTTANGDVCNKIGTYLKALAARENDVPFHVALPQSTIDRHLTSGVEIPIEYRDTDEISHIKGINEQNLISRVLITLPHAGALNPAFDVTPSHLITSYITEHGITPGVSGTTGLLFPPD